MAKNPDCTTVLKALRRFGLLLKQDRVLPNVVAIITGETLTTSWWSHPQSHAIFHCLAHLADHPDVLFTKLVAGKDTLIHRHLWPDFLAVATAGEPWQYRRLTSQAKDLLSKAQGQGPVLASGAPVKELEKRLLVHGEQVHTASGRHETQLETWAAWADRVACPTEVSAQLGKTRLEAVLQKLGGSAGQLPWHITQPKRKNPPEV